MSEVEPVYAELEVAPAYGETGLELPPGLPVERWAMIGKTLGHMYRGNRWWLADWINYGERTYDGDMFNQYVDVCGLKPQALSDVGWVGRQLQPSRRREESTSGLTFSHHREVAPLEPGLQDQLLDQAEEEGWTRNRLREEVRELTGGESVHFSSKSPEWYTPPHVIESVLEVLGEIDLDPCADDERGIPAVHHYTKEDDGLTQAWRGRVYMNPPYGKAIGEWVSKLAQEHERGNATQAIALVPSRTDTEWFSRLRNYPRCFIRGRLRFSGHENSAPFPSAAFYLGKETERFAQVFTELGDVFEMVRHDS